MKISLLSGRSHPALAKAVGARLGIEPADHVLVAPDLGGLLAQAIRDVHSGV